MSGRRDPANPITPLLHRHTGRYKFWRRNLSHTLFAIDTTITTVPTTIRIPFSISSVKISHQTFFNRQTNSSKIITSHGTTSPSSLFCWASPDLVTGRLSSHHGLPTSQQLLFLFPLIATSPDLAKF